MSRTASSPVVKCFHCGEDCSYPSIVLEEKSFCCEGCRTVYGILSKEGMCTYYDLNASPGANLKNETRKDKFSFLDNEEIAAALIDFRNEDTMQVLFYLPQIHCSSCLWLLENLPRLNNAVVHAQVDFSRKELRVLFRYTGISLRQLAELLTHIGYEPYISLNNLNRKKAPVNRSLIFRLGVAGFCFANIMLMSFPEYLGLSVGDAFLGKVFRYMNLLLSLPVFFYAAMEFFYFCCALLRLRHLNIDAPIALALAVTFSRSVYEVLSGTGTGYFDSMSGIVFFMLAGRALQDRTYRKLSFERDYTSYFPIAVTVVKDDNETSVPLPSVKLDDTLLIHHGELIPADGIVTRGKALIDYNFVTGESAPVEKEMGEIIYAGGKQVGGNIELLVIREVTQSYLTGLWNKKEKREWKENRSSLVETISRWFTWAVLSIALFTGVYWYLHDTAVMWNAVTAVLIVACPCALLLCDTFTNGNMLRIFSKRGLYFRNAEGISKMAEATSVVFDKTGTLTSSHQLKITYEGHHLCEKTREKIATLAGQSTHPLSKGIVRFLQVKRNRFTHGFSEKPGQGIEGIVDGDLVSIGSRQFITGERKRDTAAAVYVAIENKVLGCFRFGSEYRPGTEQLLTQLKKEIKMAVISGDNESERFYLQQILGTEADIRFQQKPEDKLVFMNQLAARGERAMMVGDGLNDAPAPQSAHLGIAVTDDTGLFTPASDAILEGKSLRHLHSFIHLAKSARRIVLVAFVFSVLYNIAGISFAVSGALNPMIAAILMPASSITIFLLTYGLTSFLSRSKHDNNHSST